MYFVSFYFYFMPFLSVMLSILIPLMYENAQPIIVTTVLTEWTYQLDSITNLNSF